MKNIIVTIDFSAASKNALGFARDLCSDAVPEETVIKVTHVYNGLLNTKRPLFIRPGVPIADAVLKEVHDFIDSEEIGGEHRAAVAERVKITAQTVSGSPINRLIDLSEEPETDLIVMGTAGENQINIERRLFGSVASETARKAHCPVLLVPPGAVYRGFKKVMIATDDALPAEVHLRTVKLMTASNKDVEYHLVHIAHDNEKKELKALNTLNEFVMTAGIPQEKLKVKIIESPDIDVSTDLRTYAENNEIDLTVVTTKHRNFFQDMFAASHTQEFVLYAELPVLVLHDTK